MESTFFENNRLTSIEDETEISQPTSENLKLQYKLKSFQQNLARLKTTTGASGKCWKLLENDRIELENVLISFKSQIDQLQKELQTKQARLETYENKNNALMKCKSLS